MSETEATSETLLEKADRSLRAAQLLKERGFAAFAASRAYYAMFYVAEALLLTEGLAFSRHSAVIAKFGEHFARTERIDPKFHRFMLEAQTDRLKSDYTAEDDILPAEADRHIANARDFLAAARTLISNRS